MTSAGQHRERVAIVTGGSSGIGWAIAQQLQRDGAKVKVLDINPLPAVTDVGNLSAAFFRMDVAHEAEVEKAFDAISRQEGRIDYLICCAAILPARPFLELRLEEWRRTLEVNLTGSFLCCRAALRSMRPQQFGRVVLFSSLLARTGGINFAHYAASKGGVLGLARTLALEVAHENIRVNTISPGIVDTPQPRGYLSEEELQARGKRIPLGRIGKVEDIVESCLFLLGEESSYFTGQDIRVSGGLGLW